MLNEFRLSVVNLQSQKVFYTLNKINYFLANSIQKKNIDTKRIVSKTMLISDFICLKK